MRFWNLIPDDSVPEDGVLDIEGPIGTEDWYEDGSMTGSRLFKKALQGVKNVTVHINSPGGDVMAGAEIYSALREHSMNGLGKVTVIVTALAASAASVIAMAGDEIWISPVAYMMIHNPWSFAMGDAKEMRKTARTLEEIGEGIITAYQRRTGKSRDQLKRMLENETWMSAQTAVDEGFADGVWGGEIRASAMVTGSMCGRATPEAVRAMCERWDAAGEEEKAWTKQGQIALWSKPMSGILADAADDPAPEEAAGADGQDSQGTRAHREGEAPRTAHEMDGSSVLATDEPSPGPARDAQADESPDGDPDDDPEEDPEEPETEETEPDGRTEDAFDREMAVARARIMANAMRIILNG